MAFGVYIHIPYCLQICSYCDFTKYEFGKIMPPERYVELLAQEISLRVGQNSLDETIPIPSREISTLYFGGGTPSLFEAPLILAILKELEKAGFTLSRDVEFTIEIDPATVDQAKLDSYLKIGANRFSVGAQTFNERLLKIVGRKHTSTDTVDILSLLKRNKVNYSFDLLFALPTQTLAELKADVATALTFGPSHLSAYCLTVPESHPLSLGRAPDEEQVEMFHLIEGTLAEAGIIRYEISNFAKPGRESRHNSLYWNDEPYWGLGTGAHSYFKTGDWGRRFWNAPSIRLYEKQILSRSVMPPEQLELLQKHQALTDFCHTSLRLTRGLDKNALRLKFGDATLVKVAAIFGGLLKRGLVKETPAGWALSAQGQLIANSVFESLTFLAGEV